MTEKFFQGIGNAIGFPSGAGGSGIKEFLLNYGPEALAQASDNLWSLIPGTLAAKCWETLAGLIGVGVTELLPAIKNNKALQTPLREFFSHWMTKILDPTPAEWVGMAAEARKLFSPGSFADPIGQLKTMGEGIKQNINQLLSSFGAPTIPAWLTNLFPKVASVPTFMLPTVPAQALSISPAGGYQRSAGISLPLPSFNMPVRNLFNISAGGAGH